MGLLINLAIGAVGGNLAGMLLKDKSLGVLWNSVVGILGGGLGYFLLGLAGLGASGMIGGVVASLVGGAALLFIIGLIRSK